MKSAGATFNRVCETCGKGFHAKPGAAANGRGKYCSPKCYHKTHGIPKVKKTCARCGNDFEIWPSQIRTGGALFCSPECLHPILEKTCETCGQKFTTKPSRVKSGKGKFCSVSCASKSRVGPRSGQWKGGVSFEPYCPAFNGAIKEQTREAFGRKCYLCGETEKNERHHVHHVDYNKSQGCRGLSWSLIPLCRRCHTKTNSRRWHWFSLLRDYWIYTHIDFNRGELI